jgi:hypothetical protein
MNFGKRLRSLRKFPQPQWLTVGSTRFPSIQQPLKAILMLTRVSLLAEIGQMDQESKGHF